MTGGHVSLKSDSYLFETALENIIINFTIVQWILSAAH